MALFSSSSPNLRGRFVVQFPARVQATNGLTVSKANGIWTLQPAFQMLTPLATIPAADRDNTFALVQNGDTDTYYRVSMDVLLAMVSGGLDPTLVSIGALAPGADQAIYFDGPDSAVLYTITPGGRALVGLSPGADKLGYWSASDTAALTDFTPFARTLLANANATDARVDLGLVVGANVQAWDPDLDALAGLASAADRLPYFTGPSTAALAGFTAFARSLLDDADAQTAQTTLGISAFAQTLLDDVDAAAARSTLGLVIGTDVQAQNARLADIAGMSWTQGDILYFNGVNLVRLAAGTSGHVLKTQGAGANPAWTAIPGGGDLLSTNNLADVASPATAFGNIKQAATTSATGVVELATDAEAQAQADTTRAVTPGNLAAVIASDTARGLIEIAVKAEVKAGTDTTRAVTPARQQFHPTAAKAWAMWDATGSVGGGNSLAGYNVASVTDAGVGVWVVNMAIPMSGSGYVSLLSGDVTSSAFGMVYQVVAQTAATCGIHGKRVDTSHHADPAGTFPFVHWAAFGDQ